ncbi:hypothetical protein ACIBI3_25150 [Actinomadura luteofluorescens]|uniref:hypothetical protein n=1 Tax=Actinomadura luteofluorescens TaxID=46163 RepID=UPI00348A4817
MDAFLGIRLGSVGKILKGTAVAAAFLTATVAAGCSTQSSSEGPANERPPASATAPVAPATPVASTTATAEPSASPSTSQPEATASDSSHPSSGKVVLQFEDEGDGPYLVLTTLDESNSAVLYAAQNGKESLRAAIRDTNLDADTMALGIGEAWAVPVSEKVLKSCRQFATYPSCAGSADAAPSTTTDR